MTKETLSSISRLTGFSRSTISRVLNGKAKEYRISASTVKKVLEMAREVGYRQPKNGQASGAASSQVIGLAVPQLGNSFFASLAASVILEARKLGFLVMVFDTKEDKRAEEKALRTMVEHNVEGMIVVPCGDNAVQLEAVSRHVPVMLADRYFSNSFLPYVSTNNFKGAYNAMNVLLRAGHRDILCLQGPPTAVTTVERLRGCRRAIADFGEPVRLIVDGDELSLEAGYGATRRALRLNTPPTAVFAFSNSTLLGAIKRLEEKQVRVPEDISVVSFDDNKYFDFMRPSVTRVAQPVESMGAAAVKLLAKCIQEGRTISSKMLLMPTLIERDSVKTIG